VQTIPWDSLPAKSEYYPIRVEGALCMGLRFTRQGWVHEVTLPWRGFSSSKKYSIVSKYEKFHKFICNKSIFLENSCDF